MMPKLHSKNFPGMELIRPLYCVHEDAIIAWKNYNHLRFLSAPAALQRRGTPPETALGRASGRR